MTRKTRETFMFHVTLQEPILGEIYHQNSACNEYQVLSAAPINDTVGTNDMSLFENKTHHGLYRWPFYCDRFRVTLSCVIHDITGMRNCLPVGIAEHCMLVIIDL